jgi:collagen triple helix repeat protein
MSTLRTRFGIPGLISTIALVFAMTGGAFAAKYLITSPSQIKPSVLKKLKGPKGATGATGPQGPAGAAGAAGEKGANGANGTNGTSGKDGTNGTNGADGEDGKSVVVTDATDFDCEELGGAIVKEEGATEAEEIEVCNGKPGEDGEDGEEGEDGKDATFNGGDLPPGVTMMGTWSVNAVAGETVLEAISFPIRIKSNLKSEKVHYQGEVGFETVCPAFTAASPTATEGHLCIYKGHENEGGTLAFGGIFNVAFTEPGLTNRMGAVLKFTGGAGGGYAAGSWAVMGF